MKIANIILSTFLLFGCASQTTNDIDSRNHDGHLCWQNTEWKNTSKIITNVYSQSENFESKYKISIYKNMDMKFKVITKEINGGNPLELWVIGGQSLISKGEPLKKGYEIDYVDAPALMYQLALAIISLTPEKEPSGITANLKNYKVQHETLPIKTTTPSASAYYGAPWEADVTLVRNDKENIEYQIKFKFTQKSKYDSNLNMDGQILQYGEVLPSPINNDLNISSWNQYKIGPYTKKYEGGTIFDFGAQPYTKKYKNIKEIREITENPN